MQMPQTLSIPNGEKVRPTFSKEELGARLAKLRQYMAESNLQAVLFTSYHNINYYSDFVYCRFGRDYGLVVTQDSYTTVTANIDGGQPYRRNQLGDNVVYTDWQKDNFFYALKNLIKDGANIGVEYDHMPLQNLEKMKAAFPSSDFSDIGVPTMKMRMIKSEEEIAVIKNGARVADIGGAAIREAIAVGVPEYEIALAGVQAMVREIAATYPHAELMDTWVWFQSGINTDGAHNPVTSRKVEAGDILSLNTFPMIAGYYTALERTLFSEFVSDRHLELWEINCKVHRRGLELIRPGARCCDIAAELNEIFLEHDVLQYRTFGYGHSFGTLSHYYGREAGLELREDIDTVIEPGMVVSMEPMLMLPEGLAGAGGYREHDILVVGEDSVENITKFPFGPEHNIVKS
ncbi:MAG: M24 family metallopeptidase [Oceanospirillales bacterium]|nr:M24 family metallopeptidase [Oceanospirillales bacterium]MBR9886215.1 M24 family metallopeptidase [Oceanospirillales bacterium]